MNVVQTRTSGNRFVTFSKPVNPKFFCNGCKFLLIDPYQSESGDLYCKDCKEDYRNIGSSFPDKSVSREIRRLECCCENLSYGCDWKGAYSDIESHESDCQFVSEVCKDCHTKIAKREVDSHKATCEAREVNCTYCDVDITANELTEHEQVCTQRPLPCPFSCHETVMRKNLFKHINSCEVILTGLQCPYHVYGCQLEKDETLSEHMINKSMTHVSLVMERLEGMREKIEMYEIEKRNSSKKLKLYEEQIASFESTIAEAKLQLQELKQNIKKNDTFQIEDFNSRIEHMENQQRVFTNIDKDVFKLKEIEASLAISLTNEEYYDKQKDIEQWKTLENKLKHSKRSLEELEDKQAVEASSLSDTNIKLRLLQTTSYNGRIIWRVENIHRILAQSKAGRVTAIHSSPCYVSRFGYKYCTRLYLNGDGVGKNSHVSIFFVLMKGDYDNLLTWPFVKRIKFRILNQEDKSRTREETFLSDGKSSSFKKPTQELNIAAGCPLFMEIDLLKEGGFIMDDCLFVETIVEEPST